MKPWGRFVIIFIAYGIALLHTGVPHHHAQSGTGGFILVHGSCGGHSGGGFLQRVLSTDLGLGHLENFKKSPDTSFRFSSGSVTVFGLLVQVVVMPASLRSFSEFFGSYFVKFRKRLLLFSTSHFRAPPAIS